MDYFELPSLFEHSPLYSSRTTGKHPPELSQLNSGCGSSDLPRSERYVVWLSSQWPPVTLQVVVASFLMSHLPTSSVPSSLTPFKVNSPPILTLPNELLAEILKLSTFSSLDEDDFCQVPVRLSQICSRVRGVALSTGSLWTRIVLAFPYTSDDLLSLAVRLGRSKNCPLDIYLDMRDPDWDWDWDSDEQSHAFTSLDMDVLLRFLLPQAHRWRRFELLTDTWAPLHTFLSRSQVVRSVPKLQTLHLSRCNAYLSAKGQPFEPKALQSPVALFGGASLPRLRELSLAGVHFDWNRLHAPSLSKLELKFHSFNVMPTLSAFSSLVSRLPYLDDLTMMGWGPQLDDISAADNHIAVPQVTNFTLGLLDAEYGKELLSCLSFPNLISFHLEDLSAIISPEDRLDASSIVDRLACTGSGITSVIPLHGTACPEQHSSPVIPLNSLRSLTLHSLISNSDSLRHLFLNLPRLSSLCLIAVENNVFRSLLPSPDGPGRRSISPLLDSNEPVMIPCPSLTHLSCRSLDILTLSGLVVLRKSMSPSLPLSGLSFSVREDSWDVIHHLHSALASHGVEFTFHLIDQ